MSFTRQQFDQACKEFIQKHDHSRDLTSSVRVEDRGKIGWSWREHAYLPGFGFMERIALTSRQRPASAASDGIIQSPEGFESSLELVDDAAAVPSSPDGAIVCHQYIVLSSTFQVPTFYFFVHDSSGVPLALADVMQTPLFRRNAYEGAEVTAYSVEQPSSNFPLLSFGDHPTLNIPCWFLHPCETGPAVDEILAATGNNAGEYRVCWLEAWFAVLSSVLDLVP